MSLSNFFGWSASGPSADELPEIFPLRFQQSQFIEIDVINIFQKILTDVMERTHGLDEEQSEVLWDNCIQSEANHGLISLVARAMAFRKEAFLVYDKTLNLLRIATATEQQEIQAEYKAGQQKTGRVYISFSHFLKADLVALYSALEYLTISSLNKSMNLSTALQYKVDNLRATIALNEADAAKKQAVQMNTALGQGKNVFMDAKDKIETAIPDLTAIQSSIEYLNNKRAFYLGLPCSYFGEKSGSGLGDTGEADTKGVERGLKNYYHAVMKPILRAIFGDDISISYKSQDFRLIDQGLNALKTFALVDEELMSLDNKTLIINKLFDFDEDEEGDGPDPKETLTPEQVGQNNTYPVI